MASNQSTEYEYELSPTDVNDSTRDVCASNGVWEQHTSTTIPYLVYRPMTKQELLNEWEIVSNPNQLFYCMDDKSEGAIILVDLKTCRVFYRNQNHTDELTD